MTTALDQISKHRQVSSSTMNSLNSHINSFFPSLATTTVGRPTSFLTLCYLELIAFAFLPLPEVRLYISPL